MRISRAVPVIVAVWVALVTVGSTVVWGVISEAGQHVVTARAPIGSAMMPAAPAAKIDRTSRALRRAPTSSTRSPGAAVTAAPRRPSPTASDPSPADSSPALHVALPPVSRSVSDRPSTPSVSVAMRAVRSATWHGLGGIVTVQCSGAAIRLVDAEAADGYELAVEDPGPDLVAVAVTLDGVGESEVRAECVSGVPSFLTESD